MTKTENAIKQSRSETEYNAIIKVRKQDLKHIKELLQEIPNEVLVENFSLEEHYESNI